NEPIDLLTRATPNAGWQLTMATAINNQGKIIGAGFLNGQPHGWLLTPVQPPPPAAGALAYQGDFDGNGTADLLWHPPRTGQLDLWLLQGLTVHDAVTLLPASDPQWHIEAVGDLDGDGQADLLWRHARTGDIALWFMHGPTVVNATLLARVDDLLW